jgi:hypothetical protein
MGREYIKSLIPLARLTEVVEIHTPHPCTWTALSPFPQQGEKDGMVTPTLHMRKWMHRVITDWPTFLQRIIQTQFSLLQSTCGHHPEEGSRWQEVLGIWEQDREVTLRRNVIPWNIKQSIRGKKKRHLIDGCCIPQKSWGTLHGHQHLLHSWLPTRSAAGKYQVQVMSPKRCAQVVLFLKGQFLHAPLGVQESTTWKLYGTLYWMYYVCCVNL